MKQHTSLNQLQLTTTSNRGINNNMDMGDGRQGLHSYTLQGPKAVHTISPTAPCTAQWLLPMPGAPTTRQLPSQQLLLLLLQQNRQRYSA